MKIERFQNKTELTVEHPEVKNWRMIYQAPRGQHAEAQTEGVRKAMNKAGTQSPTVYQIGDLFWIPATTTPTLCLCLEHVGDNGSCPVHIALTA